MRDTDRVKQLVKFERLCESVRNELAELSIEYPDHYPQRLEDYFAQEDYTTLYAKIVNVEKLAKQVIPEHLAFLTTAWTDWKENTQEYYNDTYYNRVDAIEIIDYILELVNLEKSAELPELEAKIFEGAHDKIVQATKIFQEGDDRKFPSVLDFLNSALELMLKDKLGIPITLTNINTGKIIDILVSHEVGPYRFFSEAKKHVSSIDNKIKHQGYKPSKVDCINALKATEDLESKLRNVEIKLSNEVMNKIYEGI